MNRKRIMWITRTAVFIALLIGCQAASAPLGQYVTGSLVNLLLILSVLTCGLACGLTVAMLSPWLAFSVGIGVAFPLVIPFIMLANASLVLVWYFVTVKLTKPQPMLRNGIALVSGAVLKFLILFIGVVKIFVPIGGLNEKQTAMVSAAFSYPQLITATIGGIIAIAVAPLLIKAMKLQNLSTPQPEN